MPQFNAQQQARALDLLEQMAWGDMDNAIRDLEICLRRALEATGEDFFWWENSFGPALEEHGHDEFTLPDEVIAEMTSEERLTYIARLVRSLALHYGVGYSQNHHVGEAWASSPAALLRGLNDILWLPTAAED